MDSNPENEQAMQQDLHDRSIYLQSVDLKCGMRFMHDGAPPHFSRVARQFLTQQFVEISFVGTFRIYCTRNIDRTY